MILSFVVVFSLTVLCLRDMQLASSVGAVFSGPVGTILDSRVGSDRYSLFMDECISSSDYGRRQGIFEVLD